MKIKYFFINTISGILLTSLISSNIAMKLYPKNAFFVPLLLGLISLFLISLLPNHQKCLFPKIIKKPFPRLIIIIYLIISLFFLGNIGIQIIVKNFYFETSLFIIVLFLMIVLSLIAICNINILISLLSLVSIIIIIINGFQLFNVSERNFLLVLPIDFKLDNYLWLFLLFYFLDGLLFFFTSDEKEKTINKQTLLWSISVITILSCWFIFDNYTYLDYHFFTNLSFPSLYRYKLYVGPKYLEHFNLFLIINCSIFLLFKLSLNIQLLRKFLNIKNSFSYRLIITSLLGFTILIINNYFDNFEKLLIPFSFILTFFIIIIYFYIMRIPHNEET